MDILQALRAVCVGRRRFVPPSLQHEARVMAFKLLLHGTIVDVSEQFDSLLDEHRTKLRRCRPDVLASRRLGSSFYQTRRPIARFDDSHAVMAAVCQDGLRLRYASPRLRDDDDVVLAAVTQNGASLQYASLRLRSDRRIVLCATLDYGDAFASAGPPLKDDWTVVAAVMLLNGQLLSLATDGMRRHRLVVKAAVINCCYALEMADPFFRADADIVGRAVEQDGMMLALASDRLRDDPPLVRAAVRQNGRALEFASDDVADDYGVVLEAALQDCAALEFASLQVRLTFSESHRVMSMIVARHGRALAFASDRLRADRSLATIAAWQCPSALGAVAEPLQLGLRTDRSFMLALVQRDGTGLAWASPSLQDDYELVRAATMQNPRAFQHASSKIRADPEFVSRLSIWNTWKRSKVLFEGHADDGSPLYKLPVEVVRKIAEHLDDAVNDPLCSAHHMRKWLARRSDWEPAPDPGR